jgi:sensor histidine kinase YesM
LPPADKTGIKTYFYDMRMKKAALHFLFWLFVVGARYYIQEITFNAFKQYTRGVIVSSLLSTLNIAIVYYIIADLIHPRWLKRKKYPAALSALIMLVLLYTLLDYLSEMILLRDGTWRALMEKYSTDYYTFLQRGVLHVLMSRIVSLGIIYQLFLGLSLPLFINIAMAYNRQQIRSLELARQNLQLEFNFLKSQVNPHFLFNTLNNIYSLILHDQKQQSADTVARLSAFMRYSLHEANADKISVENEILLMKDYIGLEKIRLNHTVVHTSFISDAGEYQLPPLLLIPLLENAFKYCSDEPEALIDVSLHISKRRLEFICCNTFDPEADLQTTGGIGISNVTRRLKQYYPDQFVYTVSRKNDIYSLNLSIFIL